MQNLKTELQAYLDKTYPGSDINNDQTVFGPVHIRFELGGELRNGTKKRVKQATERALTLYNETFPGNNSPLWLLIYDWNGSEGADNYVYDLIKLPTRPTAYSELADMDPNLTTEEKEMVGVRDKVRITILRLPVDNIKAEQILTGIANNEMGFEPYISQRIIFFDETTDRAFLMYDDRGCYVWSNEADKIRDLYIKRNDWIVDYHRPEIDEYFSVAE